MSAAPTVLVYRSGLLPPSETFVKEQARALARWRPVLVGERRLAGGLSIDELDVRILPQPQGGVQRLHQRLDRALGWPYRPHLDVLRSVGAQLVHAHFGPSAVELAPCVRALGLPFLVSLHGYDINVKREWWESGKGGHSRTRYPRRLLELATDPRVHFLAVSRAIRARAIEFGIPSEKISVHYIGIDTERFQPGGSHLLERRKRVLFVGRMVEKKAPLQLVRAFAQVHDRIPDAELVMVGDGPLRAATEDLAKELSLAVHFTGTLSSEQVLEQMHEARVFCLPSVVASNGDAEGFGLVLLEAQACGVPVVTSARGGAEEGILEGVSGFRVCENDVPTLAERIHRLLSDDALVAMMSKNAVEFARAKFALGACTARLESCYDAWARLSLPAMIEAQMDRR